MKAAPVSVAPVKLEPERLPACTVRPERLASVKLRSKSVGGSVNKPEGIDPFNSLSTTLLKLAPVKLML